MCYAKPGPRCSPHTRKSLKDAMARLAEAEQAGAEGKEIGKLKRAVNHAKKDYLGSPEGINKLREGGKHEEADRFQKEREEKLRLYKEGIENRRTPWDYSKEGFYYGHGEHYRTKTLYDPDGYDAQGYNAYGWDREGNHQETLESHDRYGFDAAGIHKETGTEYDPRGFMRVYKDEEPPYTPHYHHKDRDEWLRKAVEGKSAAIEGKKAGLSKEEVRSLSKEARQARYNYSDGLDPEGYGAQGYDRDGYDREGIGRDGFMKDDTHPKTGTEYDPRGYDRGGRDAEGYDRSGYNADGYNRKGLDKNGMPRAKKGWRDTISGTVYGPGHTYGPDGYDFDGYDAHGFDKDGKNKFGFTKDGIHPETGTKLSPRGFDSRGEFGGGALFDADHKDAFGVSMEEYEEGGYDTETGFDGEGNHIHTGGSWDLHGFSDFHGPTGDHPETVRIHKSKYRLSQHEVEAYLDELGSDYQQYDAEGYDWKNEDSKGYDREGWKGFTTNRTHRDTGTNQNPDGLTWSEEYDERKKRAGVA